MTEPDEKPPHESKYAKKKRWRNANHRGVPIPVLKAQGNEVPRF